MLRQLHMSKSFGRMTQCAHTSLFKAGQLRSIVSFPKLRIHPEVQDALKTGKAVVAMESTILTHGIPRPDNYALAVDLEKTVRDLGAVPATIAFIKGEPVIGTTPEELEFICNPGPDCVKVSRRDIAYVMSHGITGGTTIAGTMIMAHRAGIKVFATGGLGGVHRGAETTMDVSADLEELGRTPVAVVSAGVKAILDLEKTFEYLETKGVYVSTYGPKGANIPAFYSRDSGIPSPYNFQDPAEAAAVIHASNLINLQSGQLFCIPPPPEFEIPAAEIDEFINRAVIDANVAGIKGKAITPFLLNRVLELTDGRSLRSNKGFVKNNVILGTKIALELAKHERSTPVSEISSRPLATTSTTLPSSNSQSLASIASETQSLLQSRGTTGEGDPDCLVVGAVAVDLTCDLTTALYNDQSTYIHTSNPGAVYRTPGGVGFNVFLSTNYASNKYVSVKPTSRMISAVGPDARDLASTLGLSPVDASALDLSGVKVDPNGRTAQYIAMHDLNGELILACADMALVENFPFDHIESEFEKLSRPPLWVGVDANLDPKPLQMALYCAKNAGAKTLLEPTSVVKSRTLFSLSKCKTIPCQLVDVVTPNYIELEAMFTEARDTGKFEEAEWWSVVDSLSLGPQYRNAISTLAARSKVDILADKGLVQQAVHLLPYVPNIFVKLGQHGVLTVQLVKSQKIDLSASSLSSSDNVVVWRGNGAYSVVIKHHPSHILETGVVSVTGAGDSFVGVVLAELVAATKNGNPDVLASLSEVTKIVDRAQRAAVLTLKSRFAVSPEIKNLE
ncbi:Indigoidine synthase A like protein-domain-containing protein [Dipodascopsis uninucleata]